jgi:outer membrane protein assembly factor BamB
MVNFSTVVGFLSLGLVRAQPALLAKPVALWEAKILPSAAGALPDVLYGNGVAVSPDGAIVVSTSVSGVVTAFDALTGDFLWDYIPGAASGGAVTCRSQVVFTTANLITDPYMVYAVLEGEAELTATT